MTSVYATLLVTFPPVMTTPRRKFGRLVCFPIDDGAPSSNRSLRGVTSFPLEIPRSCRGCSMESRRRLAPVLLPSPGFSLVYDPCLGRLDSPTSQFGVAGDLLLVASRDAMLQSPSVAMLCRYPIVFPDRISFVCVCVLSVYN